MKLIELYENADDGYVSEIEEHSMDFIDDGVLLFRGSKNGSIDKSKKYTVRKDRKPLDTPEFLHVMLDVWFNDRYGVTPRKDGIFTSPSYSFAKRYGTPMVIVPKGRAVYVFSEKVEDLFHIIAQDVGQYGFGVGDELIRILEAWESQSLKNISKALKREYGSLDKVPAKIFKEYKSLVYDLMGTLDYVVTTDPSKLPTKKVEVVIIVDEYYAIGERSKEMYYLEGKYGFGLK